ncbi:MAG TPA: hypothetical protein VMG35_25420 [Bryobacteraceae bacterium]|nr:hypothetical protein [Bryobacteraceae bacterium]
MKVFLGRRIIPLLVLFVLLSGRSAETQTRRDDWKFVNVSSDLLRKLSYSLEDAPFIGEEREQLYRQIVAGLRGYDFLAGWEPEKVRETVLTARVGTVQLSGEATKQFLVQAPREFCGNGGCPFWILVARQRGLRVALSAGAGALILRKTTSQGFHDLVTVWHRGGGEAGYEVYRWNGREYKRFDCYIVADQGGAAPVITDCR